LLFFPSLQTLLLAGSEKLTHGPLVICVPAKIYWHHLIAELLRESPGAEVQKRLADYDHVVEENATVEAATASAFDVLRDAKAIFSTDMLGLFVGKDRGRIRLWGVYMTPAKSGLLQALHRAVRSRVLRWGRLVEQIRHAALPAVLTTVCGFVADSVGLAAVQLASGSLERLIVAMSAQYGTGDAANVIQNGLRSVVIYTPTWQRAKETISLLVVPRLLALLGRLFPLAFESCLKGEGRVILDSVGRILRDMAKESDETNVAAHQDVYALFVEYTNYLKLPVSQSRPAGHVIQAASGAHAAITSLLHAKSLAETLTAFFGIAQTVLFSNVSINHFARSAYVVMHGMCSRGASIWKSAEFTSRYSKALLVANEQRGSLALWREICDYEAQAVGKRVTTTRKAVAEVIEALDSAYRIRVAEDIRMASCERVPALLGAATAEWIAAARRILYPDGLQATEGSLPDVRAELAATARQTRQKLHDNIAVALKGAEDTEPGSLWPDLDNMDATLASNVETWLQQSQMRQKKRSKATRRRMISSTR
jgi:hypothetical protein